MEPQVDRKPFVVKGAALRRLSPGRGLREFAFV